MNRKARVVLVVREEQLERFESLGFGRALARAYPWAISPNNRVVVREYETVEPGFPVRYLAGEKLVFMGECVQASISNPRVEEKFLLASDGEQSLFCPAHGADPCVPFGHDGKLDPHELARAAGFVIFRETAQVRLQERWALKEAGPARAAIKRT